MVAAVALQLDVDGGRLRVPWTAWTLPGFRAWVTSPDFRGEAARATFVGGQVLIEMSPESLESHNKVKTSLTAERLFRVSGGSTGGVRG